MAKYLNNLKNYVTDSTTGLVYEGKKKGIDNPDDFWSTINKLEKNLTGVLDIIRDLKKINKS
jgi:hypothetical protein